MTYIVGKFFFLILTFHYSISFLKKFQVIQRRGNFPGLQTNFTKTWIEYRNGFGNLNGEFWIGNLLINELTKDMQKSMVLRVELMSHDGRSAWAQYSTFRLKNKLIFIRIYRFM